MTQQATAHSPLRILVIGAGPAAVDLHLPVLAHLRDEGRIELAHICDIDRGRAAAAQKRFGFLECSGDALAVLARADFDAVYLLLSGQLHFEFGSIALKSGKHLFVEKPIAPSYDEAMELAQLARERGLIAVGGHNRRFYRALLEIRERAGKGRWRYAEVVAHKPGFAKPAPYGADTWLSANGIHALDALIFMMDGLPQHISAFADKVAGDSASAFSAVMQWADGSRGVFLSNNNSGSRREEYVFHGLGQTYTVTDDALVTETNGRTHRVSMRSLGDGIDAEHESFLGAVRDRNANPPHALASLAPSLFLCELIERGYCGSVELPMIAAGKRPDRNANIRTGNSILVVAAGDLLPSIAKRLPAARLVALDDIVESTVSRPDVVAALIGKGAAPLSMDVLAKLPALEIVGTVGLSLARFDPEALLARNIRLVNASEAYADSVAEFAFALAILARRHAFASHESMREGGWGTQRRGNGIKVVTQRALQGMRPTVKALGLEPAALRFLRRAQPLRSASAANVSVPRELRGARVGLIGWSANARAFTRWLLLAKARVLVYSEHAAPHEITAAGATPASLAEVLSVDIVSLHRGLTNKTLHCLGTPELAQIRSGAVLINVARGALIEPGALLTRLKQGDVFACLDSYEIEPLAKANELRKLSNVFLTSHIAGGSREMFAAAADEVVSKIANYLAGQRVEELSAGRVRTMT